MASLLLLLIRKVRWSRVYEGIFISGNVKRVSCNSSQYQQKQDLQRCTKAKSRITHRKNEYSLPYHVPGSHDVLML